MSLFSWFKKAEVDFLAEVKQNATEVLGWFHEAVNQLEGVAEDANTLAAEAQADADKLLARKAEAEKVVTDTTAVAANLRSLLTPPTS